MFQANKKVSLGFPVWVCMCIVRAKLGGYWRGEKLQCTLRSGDVLVALDPPPWLFYPSLFLPQHCSPPPSSHHHNSTHPSSSPSLLFCPSLFPASPLFCCHRTLSTPMSGSNQISVLKVVCVCCVVRCVGGVWMRWYRCQNNHRDTQQRVCMLDYLVMRACVRALYKREWAC